MPDFKTLLSKYKLKKLVTLNQFVDRKGVTLEDAKKYSTLLKGKPERVDFIKYNLEGKLDKSIKPIFKGWEICLDTSAEINKVAKLLTVGNSYKIYFNTANGTTIVSLEHMIDECKYNDLAIFFEGNLELN